MTRLLTLGASGMLGHKLWQRAADRLDAYATVRERGPAAALLDLERTVTGVTADDPDSVARALDATRPDAVVNCIGVVKQADAAADPVTAIRVNALFPHQVAALCRARGTRLVHISTDCVFSGDRGSYTEDDLPDARDLYGRSKLLGEVTGPGCLTLRTSIVGRELSGAHGLLEWFLAQRGGAVRGFTRAIFSGLTTAALADVILDLLEEHPHLEGLYHVAAEPIAKHDLLVQVRDALGLDVEIEPDDALRIDRSLDATRFRRATGWSPPSWTEMVATLAADPTPYEDIRSQHAHR